MRRPTATLAMRPPALADDIFGPHRERLDVLVDLAPEVLTETDSLTARKVLAGTEVLLAGWGCPALDESVLGAMPALRAVIFAGGAAGSVLDTAAAVRRGISFTNTGEGNAQAVAEFTLAAILLAGKRATYAESLYRTRRTLIDREIELRDSGNYARTVGLVGFSRTGRRVARMLSATELDVLVYDPYAGDDEVRALGGRRVGLRELLASSDVVSLHAPATEETRHMIGRDEFGLMRDGATLINTARGALVDHGALRTELRTGRLSAVLDVTEPEPLDPADELWDLPNVTLTPHIAGATGTELHRFGRDVLAELDNFVHGRPFGVQEPVTESA